MGEILEFRPKDRTAIGRFLLAVEQQEQEAETERIARQKPQKPTAQQSAQAKRELDFIFSGVNEAEAEELYRQGLDDIVHQRHMSPEEALKLRDQLAARLGIVFIENGAPACHDYTPAATFYTRVQSLIEISNWAFDGPADQRLPLND